MEHRIVQGAMMIACDGLSALKQAQYQQITDLNLAHYDLISTIQWIQSILPLAIKFKHVKGHQDNGQSLALSRTGWMNIEMDDRVKQKDKQPYHGPETYTIPFKGWKCNIQGHRITKNLPTRLGDYINGITIQHHWASKRRYGNGTADMVDWEATDIAMRTTPMVLRCWVSKSAAKFLPYGVNMKRWQTRLSAQCPRCQEHNETKQHLFQCQVVETKKQWDTTLQQLDKWLKAQNTNPELRNKLIWGLWQWQTGNTATVEFHTSAAKEQSLLGWEMMMEGVISGQWRELQVQYWKMYKSQKSSKWWTVALIKKLFK